MNKIVYVAVPKTQDGWSKHGYAGALKIADDRNPQVAEAPNADPGAQYIHGWGVHNPSADHDRVFSVVASEIQRLRLNSYGLDLEFGWEYDADRLGWQIQPAEWSKVCLKTMDLFEAAKKHLAVPLWVTCLANKYYPYALWYHLGAQFVSPQLYGADDILPDALGSWNTFNTWLKEQSPAFPKPQGVPKVVPRWAWDFLKWHNAGSPTGQRPADAPHKIPEWCWQWLAWKHKMSVRDQMLHSGIPSLWKGQSNPRDDGQCIRFDAEIMTDADYRW